MKSVVCCLLLLAAIVVNNCSAFSTSLHSSFSFVKVSNQRYESSFALNAKKEEEEENIPNLSFNIGGLVNSIKEMNTGDVKEVKWEDKDMTANTSGEMAWYSW